MSRSVDEGQNAPSFLQNFEAEHEELQRQRNMAGLIERSASQSKARRGLRRVSQTLGALAVSMRAMGMSAYVARYKPCVCVCVWCVVTPCLCTQQGCFRREADHRHVQGVVEL